MMSLRDRYAEIGFVLLALSLAVWILASIFKDGGPRREEIHETDDQQDLE